MTELDSVVIRLAKQAEQPLVDKLAGHFPETHEFPYLWQHWGNWGSERNLPIVALVEDTLVGFHANAYNTRGVYVNLYFHGVLPLLRGRGVGRRMLDFTLQRAQQLRLPRLKLKIARDNGRALRFWWMMAVVPFAYDAKHYLYDIDISHASNCVELANWIREGQPLPIPHSALEFYLKKGATLL